MIRYASEALFLNPVLKPYNVTVSADVSETEAAELPSIVLCLWTSEHQKHAFKKVKCKVVFFNGPVTQDMPHPEVNASCIVRTTRIIFSNQVIFGASSSTKLEYLREGRHLHS